VEYIIPALKMFEIEYMQLAAACIYFNCTVTISHCCMSDIGVACTFWDVVNNSDVASFPELKIEHNYLYCVRWCNVPDTYHNIGVSFQYRNKMVSGNSVSHRTICIWSICFEHEGVSLCPWRCSSNHGAVNSWR
jgi:hypothetical protein